MRSLRGHAQARLVLGLIAVIAIGVVTIMWARRSSFDGGAASVQRPELPINFPPIPDFPLGALEPAVRQQFQAAVDRLADSPLDAQANGRLGLLYHAYEFYALAEPCYRRAIGVGATEGPWRYYLGLVLLERGEWGLAAGEFSEFLAVRPGDIPALLHRADTYRLANRLEAALDGYRAVISRSTEIAQAYCGAGQILYRLGEFEPAVEYLQEAVRLAPKYGTARYALGQALRNPERPDEARRELQLAEEYRNHEPPLDDPLARVLDRARIGAIEALHRGIDLLQAGEVDEAIDLLETAIRSAPDLVEARAQLGAALLQQGDLPAAQGSLEHALELESNYVEAIYHLGLIAHRRRDHAGAIALFQRTVQLRAEHFDAHLGLGTDLPKLGQTTTALEHLRRAMALRPHDPRPYRRMALVLSTLARYEEAIATLRLGRERLPEEVTIADRLAWMLATCPRDELREADEALKLATEVCRRTNNQAPQALDTRAAALANLGRYDEAVVVAQGARQAALAGNKEQLADQIQRRQELYQTGQPYRQSAGQ